MRETLLSDMLLPMCKNESTLQAPPWRTKLRTDIEEPIWTKLATESDELIVDLFFPNTLKAEPILMK